MSRKSRNRRDRIRADLERWFQAPRDGFVGVIVFQRRKLVKLYPRAGMAANSYQRDQYLQEGSTMLMPFGAQPNEQWATAYAIGFASTVEEALDLICNGKNEDTPASV